MTSLQHMLDAPSHQYTKAAWHELAVELAEHVRDLEQAAVLSDETLSAWEPVVEAAKAYRSSPIESMERLGRILFAAVDALNPSPTGGTPNAAPPDDDNKPAPKPDQTEAGDDEWRCDTCKYQGGIGDDSCSPVGDEDGCISWERRERGSDEPAPGCTPAPPACPEPAGEAPESNSHKNTVEALEMAAKLAHGLYCCHCWRDVERLRKGLDVPLGAFAGVLRIAARWLATATPIPFTPPAVPECARRWQELQDGQPAIDSDEYERTRDAVLDWADNLAATSAPAAVLCDGKAVEVLGG